MLVLSELGFRNWAYVFCFSLGLIVSFVIRWKWNKGIERQKEVMRLVAMAAEEAARAELQAKAEYYYYNPSATATAPSPSPSFAPVSVVQLQHEQPQCVVCYSPTTNRCARCKAVRYCSGKCQIIHWRLGHKNECHPPKNTFQFKDLESGTDQKVVSQKDKNDVYANAVEIKESNKAKPLETYIEEPSESKPPCKNDGKIADTSVILDNCSTSSLVGNTSTAANEPLVDASVSELPPSNTSSRLEKHLLNDIAQDGPDAKDDVNGPLTNDYVSKLPASSTPNRLEEPLSNDIAHDGLDTKAGVNETLADASVSELPTSTTPRGVEKSRFNDDITKNEPDTEADANGTKLSKSPPLEYHTSNVSADSISHRGSTTSLGSSISDSKVSKLSIPSSEFWEGAFESNGFGNSVQNDSYILGSRGAGSLSSGASCDSTNSGSRGELVSSVESSSVRKVVPHFKVYKVTKHHASGFGFESAEKYKYKMLFPYELFVKLYHWNKVELQPCGLTNSGNSCYANVVLQCLAFTRPLTAYLLQGFHSKSCLKKEWCFMCEFERLILRAKEGKSPLSPVGILSQLHSIGCHLGHGRQEDAHEFLRYVIDTMQSVCLKEAGEIVLGPSADETTLVGYIFGGYLRSKITCMKCHGKSERRERMMDLTVEIHGNIGTLEEALKKFTSTEILDGENKYQCLRCRSHENAKKKLTILEAPNVLTIALKRFQSGESVKLNKPVQFPEFLNLVPYMSGTRDRSPIYRLYAVVVHRGITNAVSCGHYVCYVRTIQGKWFNIDDSIVKPVELDRVLSEEAYMLLYARRSPWAPRLIRSPSVSIDRKIKERRWVESVPSSSRRPNSTVPAASPYTAEGKTDDHPYWTAVDGPVSFESFDRFHPLHRMAVVDSSSSETSSLFSNSDEGSFSTESTRDSNSTDDFSDNMFGEAGHSWNSPLRVMEESDRFSPLAAGSERHLSGFHETSNGVSSSQSQESGRRKEGGQDERSLPVLQSETGKHNRKLTNSSNSNTNSSSSNHTDRSSSRSTETNSERLGRSSSDVNSSVVSQRRFTQERTVQTFY